MSAFKSLVRCGHCGNISHNTLLFEHEFAYRYVDEEGYAMSEPATYTALECETCTELSLYVLSDLHDLDSGLGERVYPETTTCFAYIPESVGSAYREALLVKRTSRPAFVLLGRKVLEEIAKEQGAWKGNLANSLASLSASGKLTPVLSEASTLIRLFGNEAAHKAAAEFNEHHVDMVAQFLSLLIDHIYVTQAQLNTFKHLLDVGCDDA